MCCGHTAIFHVSKTLLAGDKVDITSNNENLPRLIIFPLDVLPIRLLDHALDCRHSKSHFSKVN